MREELFISGRENLNIDPVLHIWHWQIPTYLFLGGLAAGVLFFAGLYTIQGKENQYKTAVRRAPIIAPFALVLGLFALFLDLKHKAFFWQLYTTIKWESPMSWGAWTLMAVTPLSFIWVAIHIREFFPNWNWRYDLLIKLEAYFSKNKVGLAWMMVVLAVILGVYTGILLSAFNARPLWNTSILGPLFLVSGLSTGAATIMWMSEDKAERKVFSKIDLILIAVELFFIIHLFMGFLASSEVQIQAAELFLNGKFTMPFWVFVVGLGLLIPAILEIIELSGRHIPVAIPALLILIGGMIFRFIMVEAGQVTRYLY
jgi:protein NrfD